MTSEDALREKLPLVIAILEGKGIAPGKYSVSTYTPSSGEGFGCRVSPTTGNSPLFTPEVQDELISEGIDVNIS